MKSDTCLENRLYKDKLPGWKRLSEEDKLRLLDTARYQTYRRGGSGRQVIVIAVCLLLFGIPLLLLPALLVDSLLIRSLGIFLLVVTVLLAGRIDRCYQLLPALERLINAPPPGEP